MPLWGTAGATSAGACSPETTQYCPSGAVQARCSSVLVIGNSPADVQGTLWATGAFDIVDAFNPTTSGTPQASQLAAYHAVVLYASGQSLPDTTLLGDRLAAYHDQGGGVVVMFATNMASWADNLQGAYGNPANGYALLDYAAGGFINPTDTLGEVLEPESPLLAGVSSFNASAAYRSTAPVISDRGVVVARWGDGGLEPLVVRGARGGRTLVELNFFPMSGKSFAWAWSGDGAALLRNALKYSRCMLPSCGPGTFLAAGERQRGSSLGCWRNVQKWAEAAGLIAHVCSREVCVFAARRHMLGCLAHWADISLDQASTQHLTIAEQWHVLFPGT